MNLTGYLNFDKSKKYQQFNVLKENDRDINLLQYQQQIHNELQKAYLKNNYNTSTKSSNKNLINGSLNKEVKLADINLKRKKKNQISSLSKISDKVIDQINDVNIFGFKKLQYEVIPSEIIEIQHTNLRKQYLQQPEESQHFTQYKKQKQDYLCSATYQQQLKYRINKKFKNHLDKYTESYKVVDQSHDNIIQTFKNKLKLIEPIQKEKSLSKFYKQNKTQNKMYQTQNQNCFKTFSIEKISNQQQNNKYYLRILDNIEKQKKMKFLNFLEYFKINTAQEKKIIYTQISLYYKLLIVLKMLKRTKISILELMNNQVFSKQPYQKPNSKQFFKSINKCNFYELRYLLSSQKYLVHDFDEDGQTSFLIAVKNKNLKLAKFLLEYGSDIETTDNYGNTPLKYCLLNHDAQMLFFLIENDLNCRNFNNFQQLISQFQIAVVLNNCFQPVSLFKKGVQKHVNNDFYIKKRILEYYYLKSL